MWELAFTVVIPAVYGSLAVWFTLTTNRKRLRSWADALESCGLKVTAVSSPMKRLKVEARGALVEARVESSYRERHHEAQVVLRFPGPPGFSTVRIRRELVRPLPGVRETEIGDPLFDARFYLGGPPHLVCALLDGETRELLSSLLDGCTLEIVAGEIRAEMGGGQIDVLLPPLLDLCQRFADPADVPSRLAANAQRDRLPAVRLQNLALLATEFSGHAKTLEALRAARPDASPQIRLRAALELGAEGRDLLVQIAEGLEDDECSAKAVSVLGGELPSESARDVLALALRRRRIQTAHACLETLGKSGGAEVAVLAKVMAIEKGELAAVAALALGTTGSAGAESPLIQALKRDPAALRVAAAKALAEVGSAMAVLPLKEAAGRFPRDQDLRRATRQAIATIQSHVQGASPGQLSLATGEAGQLSLAQTDTGQLSLSNDADGQLSLSGDEEGPA